MEIDIYDFDETLFPFDSGSQFALYCLRRYPWTIICLPIIAVGFLLVWLKLIGFTKFKKICFIFVPLVPLNKAVKGFWDEREGEVHKWFLEKKRECVVISASPDFLLEEIAKRLPIDNLICTRHSRKTGMIIGENCRGEEKVRRLREIFPDAKIIDVYSDSLKHDKPIFSLAQGQCYQVVKGELVPFDFNEKYKEFV